MAQRRMFTKKITESDAFLTMPLSAQCLYFHLNMNADDDGFVNNPKTIIRFIGANEDDFKLLIAKAFLLAFENGVVVIKHWWMHNTLKNDRYKPTDYQEEKELLDQKTNNSYTWKQNGNILETQPNITKPNITKPIKHKYGEYDNVLLSDEEMEKLKKEFPSDYLERIERVSIYCASTGKTYKNYLATIRNWAKKDNPRVVQTIPHYDTSNNPEMSAEEEELLKIAKGEKCI